MTPAVLLVAGLTAGLSTMGCIMRNPGSAAERATATQPTPQKSGATARSAKFGTVPGIALLGPTGIAGFQVNGDAKKVVITPVTVEGQPFQDAVRAQIKEAGGSEWSVQLQTPTLQALEKGDLVSATFFVRAIEPQEGSLAAETQFVFERAGAPYNKSVTYPVKMGPEWRKIQVRFAADDAYPAGGAQMIFRLGYEPEVFELGGVTIENFKKAHVLWDLPTTEQADHRADIKLSESPPAAPLVISDGGDLNVEVSPRHAIGPISPLVYGINSQSIDDTRTTIRRMGGNRQTVYNWENNASSAGSDWKHVNDDWPCTSLGYDDCAKPAGQMLDFVAANKKAGVESLITVPMSDYVAADKSGPVPESEKAPSARYMRSLVRKPGPLAATPDLADKAVYQDEFVSFVVKQAGRADHGGTRFYSLDNEPALWSSTHPRVHPERPTYKEVLEKTEATAAMVTELDPSAEVLGGVMFGWSEYMSLVSATDSAAANARINGNYIDVFLDTMKQLEARHKRRLVHVLDVHWYPEARGAKRITESDVSQKTVAARLEAPRSLWDPTYSEKSWIAEQLGKPIRLIPWLREIIAKRYPGTKLSMTEYNYGAGEHISGGLAQIDVLGALGREGVYLANYWGNGAGVERLPDYIASAFKLYRNYDGKGGAFGDTAVAVNVGDLSKASVYAATDSRDPHRLTIIVINKSQNEKFNGHVKLTGAKGYTSAEAFVIGPENAKIKAAGVVPVKGNALSYALPPLTATLFVLKR